MTLVSLVLMSIGLDENRQSPCAEESVNKLLEIENLKAYFYVKAGTVKAVDGINLDLEKGTKLGIVGESGSGKTTMALAILRMIRRRVPSKGKSLWMGLTWSRCQVRRCASTLEPDRHDPPGRHELSQPGDAGEGPNPGRVVDHDMRLSKSEAKSACAPC